MEVEAKVLIIGGDLEVMIIGGDLDRVMVDLNVEEMAAEIGKKKKIYVCWLVGG